MIGQRNEPGDHMFTEKVQNKFFCVTLSPRHFIHFSFSVYFLYISPLLDYRNALLCRFVHLYNGELTKQ